MADQSGLYLYSGGYFADDMGNIYYSNGSRQSDINGNLFYGDGNILANSSDVIYYGGGDNVQLCNYEFLNYPMGANLGDNAGNLYYSSGALLADVIGTLYYGNGEIISDGTLLYPPTFPSVAEPAYVAGGIYFNTTLKRIRFGGASAWETLGAAVAGTFTATGAATSTFTVTTGVTMPDTSYTVDISPRNALSAALWYISDKTTTTFTVTYLTALTGAVAFDWSMIE